MRNRPGSPRACEGVKHEITGIGSNMNNTFNQTFWFWIVKY